jgi:SpoIID/LytB domain protein
MYGAQRRLLTIVVLVSVSLPGVVSATAGSRVSFLGSGWGDGVGLSQYGARGMADGGSSAAEILSHYFPDTTVRQLSTLFVGDEALSAVAPLWIGLLQNQAEITFRIEEESTELCFDDTGTCVATAVKDEKWKFGPGGLEECAFSRLASDGGYVLSTPSGSCSASVRPVSTTTSIRIPLKARSYRSGTLRFRESPNTGRLQLSIQLGFEDYVRGIRELPDFWPGASLEAQAVVSRTIAVNRVVEAGSASEFDAQRLDLCACHILDNDPQQSYGGLTSELGHPFWQGRVGGTAGQVLTWNNQVIPASFTSSTGGRTESSLAAGDGYLPYLVSVDDTASLSSAAANPFSTWDATVNQFQLGSVFGFSWLSNASVATRFESGSAATVLLSGIIAGRQAQVTTSGAAVRAALGLHSSYFDIEVTPRFGDVQPEHPFGGEILGLNELGITSGCTVELFCPGGEVTRAEMAAFLVRALNLELEDSGDPFTDDDGSFFEAEIETLFASGITTGCTAILFCPSDPVTRQQMAAFLVRAFELASASGDSDTFSDDDGLFFEAEIEILYASGITSGCSATLFCPSDLVTREQMAAFLIRALAV